MRPGEYLGKMAGPRALYRELVREAIEYLPPPMVVEASGAMARHKLVSHATVAALAKRVGVGLAAARGDLWQLFNFRWISDHNAPRELGHRVGYTYYLQADVAAQGLTGEWGVVTRNVLADVLPEEAPKLKRPAPSRGPGREWVDTGGTVLGRKKR